MSNERKRKKAGVSAVIAAWQENAKIRKRNNRRVRAAYNDRPPYDFEKLSP